MSMSAFPSTITVLGHFFRACCPLPPLKWLGESVAPSEKGAERDGRVTRTLRQDGRQDGRRRGGAARPLSPRERREAPGAAAHASFALLGHLRRGVRRGERLSGFLGPVHTVGGSKYKKTGMQFRDGFHALHEPQPCSSESHGQSFIKSRMLSFN